MSQSANHARFAPVAQLASRVRQRLAGARANGHQASGHQAGGHQAGGGGLSIWLLKAALRYASRRKTRTRSHHDPDAWRLAWASGDGAAWPADAVTGIVEAGGIKLAIDRGDITSSGHLWLDGWTLKPRSASVRLEASGCTIEWQAAFATSRPDVIQAFELSLVGQEAQVGYQLLARVADYVPGRSRLALIAAEDGAQPALVLPVVPQLERSGSMWHSVHDAMRHRGPRDVAYLEASVRMLKDLRKVDWRERSAAICRSIDEAMPEGPGLKVLVLSRLHPNVAYLNLNMIAAALHEPAEFVMCSMGQTAIQRANEYRSQFASIGVHTAQFVNAEVATPSSELIEQFARGCQRRGCRGLVVYDDVAVAGAMGSLSQALRRGTSGAIAWPRQFPHAGPGRLAFAEPLAANDGPGPYWRSAKAMEHGGLGALLFDPAGVEIPSIPPFEGRGHGLEYLLKSAFPEATLSDDVSLDLVDPAGQREAQGLDMLMLLAS